MKRPKHHAAAVRIRLAWRSSRERLPLPLGAAMSASNERGDATQPHDDAFYPRTVAVKRVRGAQRLRPSPPKPWSAARAGLPAYERKPRSLPTAFAFLMSAWLSFFGTPSAWIQMNAQWEGKHQK